MVRGKVWAAAGMGDGFLCVGCIEKRIGAPAVKREAERIGARTWMS